MAVYICAVCGYMYDESAEDIAWAELPDDWLCPVCGNGKAYYYADEAATGSAVDAAAAPALRPLAEAAEPQLTDIDVMAETGESIIEPMRTREPVISWDEVLVVGAQMSRLPLNEDEPVSTRTVIGPAAKHPLEIEAPLTITHMSFGALSREAQIALARGSAAVGIAMSSGEGGILPEAMETAHRFIFEYVPNRYSVTEEYLRKVDAVEIKLGQSAKPGMGGHLPGNKVTEEIARIRGFAPGTDITSPARHADIRTPADLRDKVAWLRDATGGRPVGVKLAAGDLEADLEAILVSGPDFITIDGRAGATGAAPKYVKRSASIPTIFALERARVILDRHGSDASLIVTGGLRVSSDFVKAIAMGADAVAIGTAALLAIGCRQYRICHTGRCPVGIATQDPELRRNLRVDHAAGRLERYLAVSINEIRTFARMMGRHDVHDLRVSDLRTVNTEISGYTRIAHA